MHLLGRRIRHYRRYREVAEALFRHGFGYLLEQLDLRHLLPLRRRFFGSGAEPPPSLLGERVRLVMEELGPTFVKLGQALSIRADLLPPDVLEELSRLQDEVPPFPAAEAIRLIETETRKPLRSLFARFEEQPLAAASIAQVHRALLPTGERVVVKLRRPGIESQIETDVEILFRIAGLARERIRPELFDPVQLVEELARHIRRELDFRAEARSIQRFRENFREHPDVYVPKVHWGMTTERMLVMEYVDGAKVSDVARIEEWGLDRRCIAQKGARAFFKQVMIDGFFHGDPHPGNILVQPDGRLVFLDFGVVGRLDEEAMSQLAQMFLGVVNREMDRVVAALTRLGAVHDSVDLGRLRTELRELIDLHYDKALGELAAGEVLFDVLRLAHRFRIRVPSDLLLLARAFIAVEGMGELLDPEFNAFEAARPLAAELLKRRLDPKRLSQKFLEEGVHYAELLARLPQGLDLALARLNRGETEIRFRLEGLERLAGRLDAASNRMSSAVIIASLIVGSSLIVQAGAGPLVWGVPLLGLLGYGVALLVWAWLILSARRAKRL